MIKVIRFSVLVAMLGIALISFGGCNKDSEPEILLPIKTILEVNIEESSIIFSWESVEGATSYIIYRSGIFIWGDFNENYKEIGTVYNPLFIDNNPLHGQNYYKIRAANKKTLSVPSNTLTVIFGEN